MSESITKTWPTPCKRSFCFDYRMNQTFQYVSGWVNLWDTIWMFFFWLGTEKVEKCKFVSILCFRSRGQHLCKFIGTKKKGLYKKRVQLPQDWFGTPTWPPFHCFRTHIWPPRRHVKTHNIFTKVGAKNRLFVEPSCSTCPVASVVPPPCASLTSSAAIPSTFCSSPFVWLYSGCPPSVTVWEKSYKQSISVCRYKQTKTLVFKHYLLL